MAMTKEEKRIFERGERARKAKEKIRKESKAGMYEGGGPGEAQGRKMATIVEKDDKENIEDYGGVDLPTNAKGGSVKKMAYGGKAMKMAKGGMPMVKKDGKMVPTFAADGVGKMSYGGKVKKMADGKMVKKKKKTTKVVRRRGDGCAVRGKTKGRMV